MRAGIGFDAHAFDPARPLVLGGVRIPDAPGLSGHSDADVVCHAVADAVLGACRLGDLGERFPATEQWSGASSLGLLSESAMAARAAGWEVASVDVTVIAERPRLDHLKAAMCSSLAAALSIDLDEVSVKATTTDRLGFTGRGEGLAALAVVLVDRAEAAPA